MLKYNRGEKLKSTVDGNSERRKKKDTFFKRAHISVDMTSAGVNPTPVDTLFLSVKHTDVFRGGSAPLEV